MFHYKQLPLRTSKRHVQSPNQARSALGAAAAALVLSVLLTSCGGGGGGSETNGGSGGGSETNGAAVGSTGVGSPAPATADTFATAVTIVQVTARPLSGVAHIDALIGESQPWNYIGRDVINFTFSMDGGLEPSNAAVDLSTRAAFNEGQKTQARAALTYLGQVTGIKFAEVSDGAAADIHFANADVRDGYTGYESMKMSYSTLGTQALGLDLDAWVYLDVVGDAYDNLSPTPGGVGYETLLHELLHVLGLKHPDEGAERLPPGNGPGQDNTATTLMSGNEVGGQHTTLGPYDLEALKWLYGQDGLGGEGMGRRSP